MKKFRFKGLVAVAVLIAALPCAVSPVLANSGPRAERGEKASGTIVRNENSVLAVESEKLTFDICDFPVRSWEQKTEYKSTVTAEYKFVNTSPDTVHTSMAFPNSIKHSYLQSGQDFTPHITVDGNDVECEVRYTRGRYNDFDDDVKLISDEYFSNNYYKPDMLVTKYNVTLNRPADYDEVWLIGNANRDTKNSHYIGSLNYYFDFSKGGDTYAQSAGNDDRYTFYVLGDASKFECTWYTEVRYYKNGRYKTERVDLPYSINYDGETTLKDLVLSKRGEGSPVNDVDYYNGVLRSFNDEVWAGDLGILNFTVDYATCWYLYDVTVEPNGSIINKITAPIFPTIHYSYEPSVYGYEYYLSPAAKWASFGKLEVMVNSSYYMLNMSDGFEKCEGGYKAEFSSLPKGELKFRMCSVENPKQSGSGSGRVLGIVFLVMLCFVCFGLPLIVFMPNIVRAVQKRREKKKLDFSSPRD